MSTVKTAHEHWDKEWHESDSSSLWARAEPRVAKWAQHSFKNSFKKTIKSCESSKLKALDLGCGIGRHSVLLADIGYSVDALDASENGLQKTQESAKKLDLSITTHQSFMDELPFEDNSFDYVLSWNVIYHGDEDTVKQCIKEILRVLRPGGIYQGTMLSKRNTNYQVGKEVAPDTWVNESKGDKAHPHYYCDSKKLVTLFNDFECYCLEDYEQKSGAYHWHLVVEKQ